MLIAVQGNITMKWMDCVDSMRPICCRNWHSNANKTRYW